MGGVLILIRDVWRRENGCVRMLIDELLRWDDYTTVFSNDLMIGS